MKNVFLKLFIAFLVMPCMFLHAQNEIKSTPQIHWLGLDFTKVKMIGGIGFSDPENIANQLIVHEWNDLVFLEYHKYNIQEFLGGKKVIKHPAYMVDYHKSVTADNLVIRADYHLTEQDIKEAVDKYNDLEKGEIYLSLIIESFNKPEEKASIWITFFNSNNEMIYTKEMAAKPVGFGFRNYWAGSIYNCLKDFEIVYEKME